jgi:Zn-finger nucleic acid-binding protein
MKCPKCSGLFHKVLFQDIQVERCSSCNGIWFDALEMTQLLKKEGSERLDIGTQRDFERTKDIEDFRCPKDGASMIKMVDVKQGHVWYESCGHCKGIFLDATEFKDLKDASILDLYKTIRAAERKA